MALKQIVVELVSDSRRLLKDFKTVHNKSTALSRTFRRLGATLAAAFGSRAVFRFFDRTIDSTNQLIKTAKGVGFTVDEYQQLIFALEQVGVSAESARIGLGDLQKRLGNPNFAKFFEEAGLNPQELQKLSPAQQLNAVLQTLKQYRGNQALLVAMSGKLLEEQSGKDFAKVILQWDEFARARQDYASRVGSLSQEEAAGIEETAYQVGLLGAQWDKLKQKIVGDAAPTILKTLERLEESGALQQLAEDITSIVHSIANLTAAMGEFRQSLPHTGFAKAYGGVGTPAAGEETPQQTAERFAAEHRKRFQYSAGRLNKESEAQKNYYIDQRNTIHV
jgi:hypothetical protein